MVICEQELNHLTKREIPEFLRSSASAPAPGRDADRARAERGQPDFGAEALAQNFDHYNTFTEYSLRQVLAYVGFERIRGSGLHLYVFYKNPMNYVAWAGSRCSRCCSVRCSCSMARRTGFSPRRSPPSQKE